MIKFAAKAFVYFCSLVLSLYGLSALDFAKFIKKDKVTQAQVLYYVLACGLAYLFGSLVINLVYYFN